MSFNRAYSLPETAAAKLDKLVDEIEARPGRLVNPDELRAASDSLSVKEVVNRLPEGFSEEDFVGILKLAMLTECATDSYSAVFREGATTYNAPWLARFNDTIWTPDEYTHYTPYQYMLQSLGYSEEQLKNEMSEVQGRHYEHCCGKTPVELTTYGIAQEYLTDNWHGMISQLMRESAPYAAQCATAVKRRETLHTIWYREMTAVQIEENPNLIPLVAATLQSFQMPGTRLVPQFGTRALEWMDKASVDFSRVTSDFVRNFYEVTGSVKRAGNLFLTLAARRGMKIGPVPLSSINTVLSKIGGPGYGIIGEAVLDKFGVPRATNDSRFLNGLKSNLKNMVARQIDTSSIIGKV
ncbi:MAG: hypothetical protein FI734_02515 [SAR202 cluster bacterium]|nr:hypothetical protein [SAR202 cluster bacterium]|tara:strand:+ start:3848 stop:4906 length:1059 start_codon:yes stop_codon:yes gene_type:complete